MGPLRLLRTILPRLPNRSTAENDPQCFSNRQKVTIMGVLVMLSGCPGLYTTICFPGFPMITEEFQAPSVVITLIASLFILFSGLSPVVWASLSEHFCIRKGLLLCGLLLLTIVSAVLAVIRNIVGLVVLRCLQSVGAACTFAVGSGIIADCFSLEQRGKAMSIFCFGIYFGPLLGPVIGGALTTTSLTWRAAFWFCTAYAAMAFLLVAFFLPETYRDSKLFDDLESKSTGINDGQQQQEREIGNQCSKQPSPMAAAITKSTKPSLWRIVAQPLFMLRYPHVLLASSIFAIALSCLLVVETLLPVLFSSHYDLSSWAIGLSYIASGAGNILGAIVNGILSDRLLVQAKRSRQGGQYVVEDRLAMHLWPCGLICMPLGMLMFGWGIQTNQSYWIAIAGFGVQAFGSQQIITCVSAYLIDAAPTNGASVSAASNLIGLILASILSTCANPMAHAIGSGFAMVFFAALALLSMGLLVFLKVYGKELRRSSASFTAVEKTRNQS